MSETILEAAQNKADQLEQLLLDQKAVLAQINMQRNAAGELASLWLPQWQRQSDLVERTYAEKQKADHELATIKSEIELNDWVARSTMRPLAMFRDQA